MKAHLLALVLVPVALGTAAAPTATPRLALANLPFVGVATSARDCADHAREAGYQYGLYEAPNCYGCYYSDCSH